MVTPGDRREPPADTKCPLAAQRKQAKRACIDEILTKIFLPSLKRTANARTALENKFVQNTSKFVFIQDGAPAHTPIRTQKLCSENLNSF